MSGRDDYVEVSERIQEFRAKYPDGCLRPADPSVPYRIERIGEGQNAQTFVVVVAAAYRTPDDPNPGIGMAWEPCPGRTNFTRFSELMNAETSAWGRALVAVGAADAKRGVASADELRNRAPESPARKSTRKAAPRNVDGDGDGEPDTTRLPDATRRKLMALFGQLGLSGDKDRAERLRLASEWVGRELPTSNDLTPREASVVIAALEARLAEPPAGADDGPAS